MGHKDLRLGKIVYILVFYNISFSWLLSLDGFQYIFLLRDSRVTVKTIYRKCFPDAVTRVDVGVKKLYFCYIFLVVVGRNHAKRKINKYGI